MVFTSCTEGQEWSSTRTVWSVSAQAAGDGGSHQAVYQKITRRKTSVQLPCIAAANTPNLFLQSLVQPCPQTNIRANGAMTCDLQAMTSNDKPAYRHILAWAERAASTEASDMRDEILGLHLVLRLRAPDSRPERI